MSAHKFTRSLLLSLCLVCSTHWHAYGRDDIHARAGSQLPVYDNEHFTTHAPRKNEGKAYNAEADGATPTDIAQESEEASAQDERTKYEAMGMMMVGGGYVGYAVRALWYYEPTTFVRLMQLNSTASLLIGTSMLWCGYKLYNNPSKEHKAYAKKLFFWAGVSKMMGNICAWLVGKCVEFGLNNEETREHLSEVFLESNLELDGLTPSMVEEHAQSFANFVNESSITTESNATRIYTGEDILNMKSRELSSLYRKTSLHLHPDRGGDTEVFQIFSRNHNVVSKLFPEAKRRSEDQLEEVQQSIDQHITRSKIPFASGVALTASSMLCFN